MFENENGHRECLRGPKRCPGGGTTPYGEFMAWIGRLARFHAKRDALATELAALKAQADDTQLWVSDSVRCGVIGQGYGAWPLSGRAANVREIRDGLILR